MARVTVDPGITLQCDVDDYLWPWTKSEPVVMLHGFARNAGFWRRWVPAIAAEHRVYRPELRGFGRSDIPPEGYRFEPAGIINDLVKVLDHFEIRSAHLVGESSGGIFSTLLALAHPDRVTSLVLCDTPTKGSTSLRSIYSLGEADGPAAILKYGVGEWCRQTLQYRLDLDKAPPELQEWVIAEMGKTPAHVGAALDDAIHPPPDMTLGLAKLVKQVQKPVLLLSGEKSKIAGDQQAAFARELPNGKLRTFQGYGHGVNLLCPEDCARAALEFWNHL